jgi:Ca2+-binding RTX toxin-like protein
MARVVYGNLAATPEVLAAFNSRDLVITSQTATQFGVSLSSGALTIDYKGQFTFALPSVPIITGGIIQSVEVAYRGQNFVSLLDLNTPFADSSFDKMLAGNDQLAGGGLTDDIQGYAGADSLTGGDGSDTLRGGDDADTVSGGAGDDAHLNGNQGNDQVSGGAGNDTIYGGKDNDTLAGDEGNDRLSGDLGSDRLTGGAGADTFVIRTGGGADTVTDFNAAEGDRILLATGQAYTFAVVGGSEVVTVGDATLTLTGVTTFSADWVVFG